MNSVVVLQRSGLQENKYLKSRTIVLPDISYLKVPYMSSLLWFASSSAHETVTMELK